jgi:hypothetical protein
VALQGKVLTGGNLHHNSQYTNEKGNYNGIVSITTVLSNTPLNLNLGTTGEVEITLESGEFLYW